MRCTPEGFMLQALSQNGQLLSSKRKASYGSSAVQPLALPGVPASLAVAPIMP